VATLLAALATFAALPAAPAAAHARLVGTSPSADQLLDAGVDVVELTFDEPVEAVEGAVEVYGPEGDRVDEATTETADGGAVVRAPVEAEAQGTYTVAWRVTSEDSHTLTGSFVFHVGTETGAVTIEDDPRTALDVVGGVGRWLGFAGTLAAAGAALLALVAGGAEAGARRRLRPLAVAGALVGLAGVAVSLVATLADGTGRPFLSTVSLVPDLAWDTRTGQLAVIRGALCALTAVAAGVGALWRRTTVPAALAAGASLVTASIAGHAWTAPARGLAVTADVAHLAAVALWVGGIAALVVALPAAEDRLRLASRFSQLALGAVAVVVVSGAVSGYQQVRSLDGLVDTGYGQLLMVKVLVFLPLLALGYVNRAHLVPLVAKSLAPLTRSLRAEVAVAGAVLAVTASLIHQAPARSTLTEPFDTAVTADAGTMDVTVDPATAGDNDIHLYFYEPDGAEMAVDAVQVTAGTADVPPRRLTVTPILPNHVTVTGASLPSPGAWTIEVTAVRQGTPVVFTFEVPIR
jgi:copper transport protein